jgi:hypothetical protein
MKQFRNLLLAALMCVVLTNCGASTGADWATADFNKYGSNYAPFPVERLKTGMSKAEVSSIFSSGMRPVSGGSHEVYAVDRWVSAPGPDYVGERLFLRFEGGKLSHWKIEAANTAVVVPGSW